MTTVTNELSEQSIRRAIQNPEGHPGIYQKFYQEYYSKIYSYCRMRTKSPKEAKQIADQVLKHVQEKRYSLPVNATFHAWMRRIANSFIRQL